MDDFFEQVGTRISELLHNKNMTQQDLAKKLAISKQVVNKIVKGQKAINVIEISKIADALDIQVDSLLAFEPTRPAEPCFSFMGSIHNAETKRKVLLLKDVIDEIISLEDYASGCN